MNNITVLFAASEVIPFAKTGGLADVAGSLPKELSKLDVDISVVMPKYSSIDKKYVDRMLYAGYVYVDVGWRHQYCGIFKLEYEGIMVYFLDNEFYFKRDALYGFEDEAERFAFFSKAVLQFLPAVGLKPDIIHCNDWQTGIIGLILRADYKQNDYYKDIKTMLTIHNLKYQGVFPKSSLTDLIGVGWEYFKVNGIEYYDQVNYLKAGIIYSDLITTVSPTYANEIRSEYFGEGLNDALNSRADRLYGILNGIDNEKNDPSTDSRLFVNYDSNCPEGKQVNKRMLQEVLGLPQSAETPLIGIISRLVDQKGFDLIAAVLNELLEMDIQIVVLGTGEYKYEELFRAAAVKFPERVSLNIKFDATLAQRIYAGSDMFLMPSLFEPCGLSQLFSLRYGTIPIVRETGGLNDTITSYNEFNNEGNGFTFRNYNADDMLYTIRRAISFYHRKDIWSDLVRKAMEQDFSWGKSAGKYLELYKSI